MSIPEQSGDSFDFCVLFRVYFIGKGAIERRQRDLEAEIRALRKQLAQKDEVIEILKKSVGILSRP